MGSKRELGEQQLFHYCASVFTNVAFVYIFLRKQTVQFNINSGVDFALGLCYMGIFFFFILMPLRKLLRIRSVISVNFHYVTVFMPISLINSL